MPFITSIGSHAYTLDMFSNCFLFVSIRPFTSFEGIEAGLCSLAFGLVKVVRRPR